MARHLWMRFINAAGECVVLNMALAQAIEPSGKGDESVITFDSGRRYIVVRGSVDEIGRRPEWNQNGGGSLI